MHHRTIEINHQPDATVFQTYPDVCLQLNMFRAFSRPSSGAQWLQWQPLVLPSYRGDSRAVFVVGPAVRLWPRYEGKTRGCHCSYWAPDDGRENARTCWPVNKRQDKKLKKLLHQVGDLFELNVKLRIQMVNYDRVRFWAPHSGSDLLVFFQLILNVIGKAVCLSVSMLVTVLLNDVVMC